MSRIIIKMKLPSLNDYIRVCRSNKYQASKFKKKIEEDIMIFLRDLPVFEHPVKMHFHWIEDNKRRDLDNICFAKKFILDAMVKAGKLQDDSARYVVSFLDTFEYGSEPMVKVTVQEVEQW